MYIKHGFLDPDHLYQQHLCINPRDLSVYILVLFFHVHVAHFTHGTIQSLFKVPGSAITGTFHMCFIISDDVSREESLSSPRAPSARTATQPDATYSFC